MSVSPQGARIHDALPAATTKIAEDGYGLFWFFVMMLAFKGILISMAGRRGLLLPQVAVEHNWDRVTFLQQTCHKAGLPSDAWLSGATIEVFAAEIFADNKLPT